MALLPILMPALIVAPALPDDWDGLRSALAAIACATLSGGGTNGSDA